MSDPISLTTELEAVNAILASVGESPIVSLSETFVDAELARKLLNQHIRSVQLHGWHWNTDETVTLQPDVDGIILLSPDTLRVKFENLDLTRRGNRVYDAVNHTYVFTTSVIATERVVLLTFDEMPEAARQLAFIRAGRAFQDVMSADEQMHQFQERDALVAWASMQNDEAEAAQHNVLSKSSLVARLKGYR